VFPSWFLRIVCDRCGKERVISETHMAHGEMLIRDIIGRMRHDGCGGRPQFVALITGIPGASRPVRRIVLLPVSGHIDCAGADRHRAWSSLTWRLVSAWKGRDGA
jgi:hypothetical protein